jgi:hypothetical protein
MVVLVVASSLVVTAPPADAASPIDTMLCSSTTSRMSVDSNFPLAICFSGTRLIIKNTTDLMIQVNSGGISGTWVRKADTTNSVALAAAALDTNSFRLPPGFQVAVPIGSQASIFRLSLAPDENRLFWMDLVSSVIPGSAYGDYTAISAFSDSMDSIHSSHQECAARASNFLATAVCNAEAAADVVSAVEALGAALVLANFTKSNLLSTADKKFAGLVSLAISLAESDESLFAGNVQLSHFIGAPKVIRFSAISPTTNPAPTAAPPCTPASLGPVLNTGSDLPITVQWYACQGGYAIAAGNTTAGASPAEFGVGLLIAREGIWTLLQAPDDGTCLGAQVSCDGGPPDTAISPTVLQALAATAGLELGPAPNYGISPPSTTPSGPGFDAAKQEWIGSPSVAASADQNVPILQAIADLQSGLTTDHNTSGYSTAIAELQNLTTLPDAMDTPAQDAEGSADDTALDTFFDTPNLYTN